MTTAVKPILGRKRPIPAHVAVYAFVIVPFLALLAAVPFAWGWGLAWLDVILAASFYTVTCLGATVGFHRYFTHGAFKARRALRVGLAVVGSMAVQGPILHWVADHRRHHAFADREGDPHSPWLFGTSPVALVRGLATARSPRGTGPPTSGHSPCSAWASRGTTCTTRTRPAPATGCCPVRSTSRRA